MCEEDVVNLAHFFQRQIPHASARIDQDVVIDQKRRGSAIAGDGALAAENADFH